MLGKLAREQEIAILLSAHDMNPLLGVMDRIMYVANGRVATGPHRRGRHLRGPHPAVRPPGGRGPGAEPGPRGRGRLARALPLRAGAVRQRPGQDRPAGRRDRRHHLRRHRRLHRLRAQSFAGHSLADIATTGGSAAFLVGLNQFWGFLAAGIAASALMEGIGVQRRRGRDVATGVVLGGALGFAALFLYLGTQQTSTTGASFSILFGSIFVVSPDTVPAILAAGRGHPDRDRAAWPAAAAHRDLSDLAQARASTSGSPASSSWWHWPSPFPSRRSRSARCFPPRCLSARRPRRCGSPGARLGDRRLRRHRPRRDLDRHRARLRVLLLAALRSRMAGELLRRRAGAGRLPAVLRQAAARRGAATLSARGCRVPADVHRPDGQHLDRREHRRRDRGDHRLLRGAARGDLRRPRHTERRIRRRGRRRLLGVNVIWGLAVFAIAGALGIGALGRAGPRRTTW